MVQVGEYIRISWSGELGQVMKVLKDGWVSVRMQGYQKNKKMGLNIRENTRIKHSFNIMDLIEERGHYRINK